MIGIRRCQASADKRWAAWLEGCYLRGGCRVPGQGRCATNKRSRPDCGQHSWLMRDTISTLHRNANEKMRCCAYCISVTMRAPCVSRPHLSGTHTALALGTCAVYLISTMPKRNSLTPRLLISCRQIAGRWTEHIKLCTRGFLRRVTCLARQLQAIHSDIHSKVCCPVGHVPQN